MHPFLFKWNLKNNSTVSTNCTNNSETVRWMCRCSNPLGLYCVRHRAADRVLLQEITHFCFCTGTSLPISVLRLVVSPIHLVAAAIWKTIEQGVVAHYGMIEEFISLVTDIVPEILTIDQRVQLTLGLRARVRRIIVYYLISAVVNKILFKAIKFLTSVQLLCCFTNSIRSIKAFFINSSGVLLFIFCLANFGVVPVCCWLRDCSTTPGQNATAYQGVDHVLPLWYFVLLRTIH